MIVSISQYKTIQIQKSYRPKLHVHIHIHILIHIHIHNLNIHIDIHISETGHINSGQQFGGGFEQDHGQYPSGPRSISLQVWTNTIKIDVAKAQSYLKMIIWNCTTDIYDIDDNEMSKRTWRVAVERTTHHRLVVQAEVCWMSPTSTSTTARLTRSIKVNFNEWEHYQKQREWKRHSQIPWTNLKRWWFCRTLPCSSSQQLDKLLMPPGTQQLQGLTARWWNIVNLPRYLWFWHPWQPRDLKVSGGLSPNQALTSTQGYSLPDF